MKFRMKSDDLGSIQHFINAIQTVSCLSKNFVMRINDKEMFFIINERVSQGGSLFWCQINYRSLFNDSSMEGLNPNNNEIMLEVISEYFLKTLRPAFSCRSVKIKLTRNRLNNPCLGIEIEQPTDSEHTRIISHEIPVRIVPFRIWDEYLTQPLPEYDVSLNLPLLRPLRNVLDKMKNLAGFLTLTAHNSGELILEIKNDQVKVRTQFSNLDVPIWKSTSNASLSGEYSVDLDRSVHVNTNSTVNPHTASVTVDIRKIYHLINSIKLMPLRMICNVVEDRLLQVFVVVHDISIQSIIPAVIM